MASAPTPVPKGTLIDVKIDIRPWGEVVVDGTPRGISPPLRTLSLPPGQHTVVVRNADLPPYTTTLNLKPGQPASMISIEFL